MAEANPATSASLRHIRDSGSLSSESAPTLGDSVPMCQQAVTEAIQRCLPAEYDKVEKLLFRLAREWKALSSDDGCPIGVREFVRRWFDEGGHTLEHSFDAVWLVFLANCDRVKFARGQGPTEVALARAREKEPCSVALQFTDERIRLLVMLCRELQILSGQSPFHLSCRKAGELIGVPFKLANLFLGGLRKEGILEEIAKGGICARGKLATRWRFAGAAE